MSTPARPPLRIAGKPRPAGLGRRRWRYAAAAAAVGACLALPVLAWPALTIPAIVMAASIIGFLVAGTLHDDGGRPPRDGPLGHESTARVLRRLRRRGFRAAHGVPLHGRDIDHVVLGEGGAVAVTTAFTHADWTVGCNGIVEAGHRGRRFVVPWPVTAARGAARDLRLLAISGGVRTAVLPVVVVWGPRIAPIAGGARWVDGVLVAVGWQWREWIDLLASDPLLPGELARVWEAVETRVREHEAGGTTRAA